MQAGRALPQARWTHPRRKPAYRRDLARVSEAALCGLPAGPSGAAQPAKSSGSLRCSHATPPQSPINLACAAPPRQLPFELACASAAAVAIAHSS